MNFFSNYRFTLDIQKGKSQVSIPVHYGDTGNRFYITFTDGGNPYTIPDGCRVDLYMKKPDNRTLVNACIIENNAVVRYEFNKNTASVEGMHKCELRLYSPEGRLITTPSFIMVVDERVIFDDEIGTEEDFQKLYAMHVIATEEERVAAEEDRDVAEKAREEAEKARAEAEKDRKDATSRAKEFRRETKQIVANDLEPSVAKLKKALDANVPARVHDDLVDMHRLADQIGVMANKLCSLNSRWAENSKEPSAFVVSSHGQNAKGTAERVAKLARQSAAIAQDFGKPNNERSYPGLYAHDKIRDNLSELRGLHQDLLDHIRRIQEPEKREEPQEDPLYAARGKMIN